MTTSAAERPGYELAAALADAWTAVERRLNGPLADLRGTTFAEYRLVSAIAAAPGGRISRVDLARRVGLTPSGVTRALRPLERLGFVETEKSERDARLALASLSANGEELLSDASIIVRDAMEGILERVPEFATDPDPFVATLAALTARA
jgi:DNA-binding MarR family transcriptional regulator